MNAIINVFLNDAENGEIYYFHELVDESIYQSNIGTIKIQHILLRDMELTESDNIEDFMFSDVLFCYLPDGRVFKSEIVEREELGKEIFIKDEYIPSPGYVEIELVRKKKIKIGKYELYYKFSLNEINYLISEYRQKISNLEEIANNFPDQTEYVLK